MISKLKRIIFGLSSIALVGEVLYILMYDQPENPSNLDKAQLSLEVVALLSLSVASFYHALPNEHESKVHLVGVTPASHGHTEYGSV